ncbi:hypothetical protein AWW71_05000 [Bacillus cereus]|uniref:Uncharacterized protein n=2 Tax=root TaxID=1 RepID=A0A1B1P794_9CAUD|nr:MULTISPECIES: hypothetical protein [Bacillus cereus group]YP_009830677.1 hypothetical protein HWA95_gp23 [Bacillus phage vB_BtS_BMBtp14]ANT39983.1 hypothetical protein BMBtpLA2_23 [Bacillus phage vB_BtS_BMBtp14]EEM55867.1 hypothetical protein bthur0007_63270 [Bacillus thuringiensis serovar monterrey BGSC 4AJ1]KWU68457.1 hypothetical protein AWW71_05000 [Bacillus cereus]KWW50457.1 hypothetical protein AWW69_01895 [Bacillus cereus]MEB9673604.1 hypothetical protein [Bacillus anthracis]
MIAEGDRVFVEDLLFKGWGTVDFVIPGEMFGIQLRMEQPDSDGHYIHRVGREHIKQGPQEEMAAAQIDLQDEAVVIAESTINTLNLKIGHKYLLSASKYDTSPSNRNCYVYRVNDGKFLGCHPKSSFIAWRWFDGDVSTVLEKEAACSPLVLVEVAPEIEKAEQLSLFDF